ncbi:MAG: thiolase family protein [Conexivisphaerales archaeon]
MDVFIISAARTPIGKYGKAFLGVPAQRLGSIALKEAIRRAGIAPEEVEEVITGNVLQAGLGQNPARQVAIGAGLPYFTNAFTVNKVCGSSLKAVMLAAQAIKAGDASLVAACGIESMSESPYLLKGARFGLKYNDTLLYDEMILDGLLDAYYKVHMIQTGEEIAKRYNLSREEIDTFAYESHMKALEATKKGRFKQEIVPVEVSGKVITEDECIRPDTSVEKLSQLKPVLPNGKFITAGNASQLSDGAAAVIVASEEEVKKQKLEPLAKIIAYNSVGLDPIRVMEAPIPGVRRLLEKVGISINDVGLFEHNEAYASASVVVRKELGIDESRFNIHGGAVALGHPLGASGARILTTLLYNLMERKERFGIATLCLGGGNAVSMVVENMRL